MTRPVTTLLTALILTACSAPAPPIEDLPSGTLVISSGEEEVRVDVSIAETDPARAAGLMNVPEMAEEAGMVFLQEEPVEFPFHMENTLIPLSAAWWDQRGEILAIRDMEPCGAQPCELYYPGFSAAGAVEVNQGFFTDRGVEVGDRVRLDR